MYFDYKILLYMYNVPSQQQKAILRPFFQVQLCEQVVSHRRDLLEQQLDFYEPDVLPATQPIVSKLYRKTQWFGRSSFVL